MRTIFQTSLAACLATYPVFGFQARGLPIAATTARSSSSLHYTNKNDPYFDVPSTADVEDDMMYTPSSIWGGRGYKDTGAGESSMASRIEKPILDDYTDYKYTGEQGQESWPMEYYGDTTPLAPSDPSEPTLGLLKSWTQAYIDGVDLAGGMTRVSVGVQDMLSPEFVFTSPTIGPLNKKDYIKLMDYYRLCGVDLASAIPDLTVTYDGWHADPHDPWRVWAIARYSGTHVGTATLPGTSLKLTPPNEGDRPAKFSTGPEVQSFLWTTDQKLLWQTSGYVGDEYTGSNKGYGGLDGLLVSMGLPALYLDAVSPVRRFQGWLSQFQNDNGETTARTKSRSGRLPQWWNERKLYDLNIQK